MSQLLLLHEGYIIFCNSRGRTLVMQLTPDTRLVPLTKQQSKILSTNFRRQWKVIPKGFFPYTFTQSACFETLNRVSVRSKFWIWSWISQFFPLPFNLWIAPSVGSLVAAKITITEAVIRSIITIPHKKTCLLSFLLLASFSDVWSLLTVTCLFTGGKLPLERSGTAFPGFLPTFAP